MTLGSHWIERFMRLAQHVSGWSKDPSTKVGAVIADGKRLVSVGYNGFPPALRDYAETLADRHKKLERIVHAEMNAVLNARQPVQGFSLYTWPLLPCAECVRLCLGAQIGSIFTVQPTREQWNRWKDSFILSQRLLGEAGVPITYVSLDDCT